jgi:hypothetical protein
MSTLAQDNTPGSVFTVIAAAAFEGSARAVMMSQNQDMFNTIEKSLSFTNNADGNGQATFTLTVPDKDSLFNGNTTDSDTVQITVNKTADNTIIYAAADMTVLTYAVPGQATALTVANGSEFSTITFVSTVGTATNEAITSVNLVCSNGTPAGASAAANQSGGLTFRNIALSTVDAPTDFAATGNAGEYTLKVTGLTDYTYYEAAVQTVSLIGNSPMSATVQLAPSNDMHAPTMSAETLNGDASAVTTSGPAPSLNATVAQLTCNWLDPDAGSLVTTGTDSHAILQISTDDFVTITNAITLTNAQCTAAVTGVTITQNVAAGTYKSRIHSNSTTSPLNQTGLSSAALQVFVQTEASMTSPLVAAVNMATGAQTFAATYTDATVAGTQVLTMTDDGASLGVGAAVVDGVNKTSTSVAVSYANCADGSIVATLTVQDANSPAIYYTYTTGTPFDTLAVKTPGAPTATFDQNAIAVGNFTSTLTGLGAANGYTVENVTYEVSESGLIPTIADNSPNLQDISGVYLLTPIPNTVEIDAGTAAGQIFHIKVTQTNTFTYTTNYPAGCGITQTVNTAIVEGPQNFKVNPVIDSIVLNENNNNKAVVTVTLNHTQLETTDALTLMMMTNIAGDGDVIVSAEVPTQDAADADLTTTPGKAIFTVTPQAGHTLNSTSFAFAAVNVTDGHTAHMGVNIPTLPNGGIIFGPNDGHHANHSMQ